MADRISDIMADIELELRRATAKHGPMASRHEAYGVILEELDEFWDEVKKNPAKMDEASRSTWRHNLKVELTQVAAMAARALFDLTDLKA